MSNVLIPGFSSVIRSHAAGCTFMRLSQQFADGCSACHKLTLTIVLSPRCSRSSWCDELECAAAGGTSRQCCQVAFFHFQDIFFARESVQWIVDIRSQTRDQLHERWTYSISRPHPVVPHKLLGDYPQLRLSYLCLGMYSLLWLGRFHQAWFTLLIF
jgi:hypothetical protein